ncbi:Fur-regulated basic protein FbpA [Bacillota bacterium Lsc_1132]
MSKQLRTAIEKAKKYYIGKIIASGLYNSEHELSSFTLSELEIIYQKSIH